MAKFHFKYGAMNSGKSDTLIKTAYNYTERGLKVVTLKPSVDTKSQKIVARGGASRDVDILVTPDTSIRKVLGDTQNLACILVDEAQFLQPSQVDELLAITKENNISVIAYGLRTDFLSQLFPGSRRLLELADNIEKLPTMCRCGNQAEFNCRQIDGVFVFEGDQVAIDGDGAVTYESLCGGCYLKEKALSRV